jgi:hypothetical protein
LPTDRRWRGDKAVAETNHGDWTDAENDAGEAVASLFTVLPEAKATDDRVNAVCVDDKIANRWSCKKATPYSEAHQHKKVTS